jgi:hypothetical protein
MIEFIEETHTYLVNGIIVPSITTILSATLFKDKYGNVPPHILKRAAEFGTGVHKAIETGEWLPLDDKQYEVYMRYLKLVKRANIKPLAHEKIVSYETLYCGTYDMEAIIDGDMSLVDIKTTYNLDREYLSWQLSFYELATGKQFEKLYCIWLPKRKGAELVEIERKSKEDIMKLLEVYYEQSK